MVFRNPTIILPATFVTLYLIFNAVSPTLAQPILDNVILANTSNATSIVGSYLQGLRQTIEKFNSDMFNACSKATLNAELSELRKKEACGGVNGEFAISMIGSPENPGEVSVYYTNIPPYVRSSIIGNDPFDLFTSVWMACSNQNMTTQAIYDGPLIEVTNVPASITRDGIESLLCNGVDPAVLLGNGLSIMKEFESMRMNLTQMYNEGDIPFSIRSDLNDPKIIWDTEARGIIANQTS